MKTLFNTLSGIKVMVLLSFATTSLFHSQLHAQYYKSTSVNTSVCRAGYEQSDPVSTEDGSGGVIVAWVDKRSNSNYDLYAQRYDAFGKALWTAGGMPVCRMTGDQYQPVILSDGSAGAIIAWIDTRSNYEIYAQRINSSGVRQWDTAGVAICATGGGKDMLIGHSDYNGGVVLAWTDLRNGYDIIAQRVDGNGNIQWNSGGLEVCVESEDQLNPSICDDADSAVIIAWEDNRSGKKLLFDIYAQKVSIDGNIHWGSSGTLVCSTQEDQLNAVVCSDDSGGAYIVWQDKRSGSNDIYAQRLDVKGGSMWTANGLNICSANNNQLSPKIVQDGSGGAITLWIDQRASNANHIYGQRLDHTGSIQWSGNGIVVCGSSGNRESPNLLEDGEGGTFVVWSDTRSGSFDVYIQKLNGNGSVSYSNNGILVSNASNDQTDNTIASDGYGGLTVAWSDLRNSGTGSDIYIQNVLKDGNLGIVSEISVKGNGVNINDNDNSPSVQDNTDMGSTKTLTAITKSYVIMNAGNDTLKISSIVLSGTNSSDFTLGNFSAPKSIKPRDSSSFDVIYTPSGIGISNAMLTINNNDSNESVFNFAIRATFKAPKIEVFGNKTLIADGDLTASDDDSTDYGAVRNNTWRNRTFEISSSGTDTLSISGIAISGLNATDFSFVPITYPRKLNGGKSMSLVISFNPTALGVKAAKVTITSNDPTNPVYEFGISGKSVIPVIGLKGRNRAIADGDNSPSTLDGTDYGKLRTGKGISRGFTIHNSGSDRLKIDDYSIDGLNKNLFSISGPSLPAYIPSGDSASITVVYNPTTVGLHSAQVKISSDDPNASVYQFAISGSGIEPMFELLGKNKFISDLDTFTELSDGTDFGALRNGQVSSSRFCVRNTGSDTLILTNLGINHSGAQGFYLGSMTPGMTILPGDSSYFDVEFKPLQRRVYKSYIRLQSNYPHNSEFEFAVSGKGVDPVIAVFGNNQPIEDGSLITQKTNNTDFDSVELDQTKTLRYKIVNHGDYILTINSIQMTGTDVSSFDLQDMTFPYTIQSGDSLVFEIGFKPSTEGAKSVNIQINSDDKNVQTWDYKLSGIGYKTITGLSDFRAAGFSMFPNPASNEVRFIIPEEVGNAEISICSVTGQEIVRYNPMTSGIYAVNLENLKDGMYIVNIITDGKNAKYRLVVRR